MRASLSLSADPAHFRRLIGFAEGFARGHTLPSAERARLLIILEELFTNTIRHGADDTAAVVNVEVSLALEAGRLEIEFCDDGRQFDPLTYTPTDPDRSMAEPQLGGFGLRILRSLVDDAQYTRDGNHNRLVLIRVISC
jgi:anti-sigma regulatory factor (Ser/Thr protein kinase)